ncbi:MAG: aspartate/glutamate racemase family protein [Opitutaceae bacterium]|jgi:glutamate racemase|nr:aspartate/glutamate racemase family protein [Opitutaceae bacterium]
MRLGVFDSGIGGEAIARALRDAFPGAEILSANDRAGLPYGDKPPPEIIRRANAAIRPLLDARCDIIVLACNTATAVAIDTLRALHPAQKFIGIEPMLKPAAALTRSGVVAVCATRATLSSARYRRLLETHAGNLRVLEPDCSDWASLIENNRLNRARLRDTIETVCREGADVIVLGCTHYHWIKKNISALAAGRARVIEPSGAIARRVRELLATSP